MDFTWMLSLSHEDIRELCAAMTAEELDAVVDELSGISALENSADKVLLSSALKIKLAHLGQPV